MAWRHGTKYGYSDKGCRCDLCRNAALAKRRAWRARAKAANSPSYQRELEASRALKKTYTGICVDCGGKTRYSGGKDKQTSERCVPCRKLYEQSEEHRLAITKWPADLILDRIREWADLHGEPPGIKDWSRYDEGRAQLFDGADGHWPWFTIVVNRFGSWNAAITAAGFKARAPHRPRKQRAAA